MDNIVAYVENNLNEMSVKSFNAVDSLVLSQFSYIHFNKAIPNILEKEQPIRIQELLKAELFGAMFQDVRDAENNRKLLFALAASPRFRNIKMNYYIDKNDITLEKQFAAVTCLLEDETAYIAFRGTDATINGWKEDFNMAFISPVPSQEESVKYLNAVAKKIPRSMRIRTGGHSKGGNLAVYSAMKCDPAVQKRIIGVFNHDGPGFKESVFESREFLNIEGLIYTTLPESSLIGMLLQHYENYFVVKSSRTGVMQHDPFSWLIENEDFFFTDNIASGAMFRNKTLNQWLNTLTDEKRKLIVDLLFQIIETTDAITVNELSEEWRKAAIAMLAAIKNIDSESKKFVSQTVNELFKLSIKNLKKPGKFRALNAPDTNS